MNLEKLFEMQRKLDEKIVEEKGLQGQDLIDKKILALQVELGELANEWRGFKFWSIRQEPTTNDLRVADYKENGEAIIETYNPLLEEYVDCLHFILSIGLDLKLGGPYVIGTYKGPNIIRQFNFVYQDVSKLDVAINEDWEEGEIFEQYDELVRGFLGLGEMLGFTREEIEQSYYEKNRINHERQENGY